MEASSNEVIYPRQPGDESIENAPSRLESLGGVITSPVKTFEHLASNPQWLFPIVIILLWVLIGFQIRMGVMSVMGMAMMAGEMGTLASLAGILFSGVMFFAGLAIMGGGVVAVLLAMAGALHFIAKTLKFSPKYYPLVTALAYAEFVPRLVRTSLSEFIPPLSGDFPFSGAELPTGILVILSEIEISPLLQPLLARIELFHIWSFVLVAISVRFTAGVPKEKAVVVTLLYWVVCIGAVTSAIVAWDAITGFLFPF